MRYLVAVGALGVTILTLLIAPPEDKVVFLDVGQGDAILIQNKTMQVLVDGGQGMAVLRRLGEELPALDRTIEVLISTHPDRDHLEGLLHVLGRYDVKLVLLPRVAAETDLYKEWVRELNARAVPYRFADTGEQLSFGEVHIDVLGPQDSGEVWRGKTNNASILTRITYAGMSFLLTGDAEASVERNLVQRVAGSLDVDVLKAGHHGSKTSTTEELLQATTPSAIVISVGAKNRYGHPTAEVLERIKPFQVFRTDKSGSIRFIYEEGKWLLTGSH